MSRYTHPWEVDGPDEPDYLGDEPQAPYWELQPVAMGEYSPDPGEHPEPPPNWEP